MKTELIAAVRDHAIKNYTRNGWDYVVEAMTDEELNEIIGTARSHNGAILRVYSVAKMLDDQRKDARFE